MTVCITPSLDCHLATKCARHFRKVTESSDPNQAFRIYQGDNAMFACPGFTEEAIEDDGFVTLYPSYGVQE